MAKAQAAAIRIDYERPFLFDYQEDVLDNPARFVFVEGSTKVGKTAPLIVWAFEQMLKLKRGQRGYWFGPTNALVKIAFERMQIQAEIKKGDKGKSFLAANISEQRLTTPAGGSLFFKSVDNPSNMYGDDAQFVVLDEGSRTVEATWDAILSLTTDTGGPVRAIANVVGRNWYWKKCRYARDGVGGKKDPDYAYFKINCWDGVCTGNLSLAEVKAAKKELSPAVYKRLYAYAKFRSVYPTNEPTRLKLKNILQAKRQMSEAAFKQLFEAEAAEDGSNPFGQKNIEKSGKGMSNLPPVCFGIDLASTVDYTVVTGLDMYGRVCYFARYQLNWPLTKAILATIPDLPIGMDATGAGKPITEDLQQGREKLEAVIFTPASKQKLMFGLATAFHTDQVTLPLDTSPEGAIIHKELDSFEYHFVEGKRTGSYGMRFAAPTGEHDDTVMSLALAYDQFNKLPKTVRGKTTSKMVEKKTNETF